jgi:hypothetical protein
MLRRPPNAQLSVQAHVKHLHTLIINIFIFIPGLVAVGITGGLPLVLCALNKIRFSPPIAMYNIETFVTNSPSL